MPYSILAVVVLLLLFIVIYRVEKVQHEKRVQSIPVRIWVNGTRGKSSVTRLIAAGLRADGTKVIAKTTGTSARIIMDDGSENPIVRLGMANIREQMRITKRMAVRKPDAVVFECMALRPDLQKTESTRITQPTIAVITNVRPDHLDVMGPSVRDVAQAFVNAIPSGCHLFCTKSELMQDFIPQLQKRNITVVFSDMGTVTPRELKQFRYEEHRENVAIALDVCTHLSADRKKALHGMCAMQPDPGVLKKNILKLDDKTVTLVNAMAANDPESTFHIWESIDKDFSQISVLVNCREDRLERTFRLAELFKDKICADNYILTGAGTKVLLRRLKRIVNPETIHEHGNREPSHVVDHITQLVADKSLIFAIGNTVGYGMKLAEELDKHRKE